MPPLHPWFSLGGESPECQRFYKRLATLLANRRGESYPETITYIRRRIRFCILRTSLTFEVTENQRSEKQILPLLCMRMTFLCLKQLIGDKVRLRKISQMLYRGGTSLHLGPIYAGPACSQQGEELGGREALL